NPAGGRATPSGRRPRRRPRRATAARPRPGEVARAAASGRPAPAPRNSRQRGGRRPGAKDEANAVSCKTSGSEWSSPDSTRRRPGLFGGRRPHLGRRREDRRAGDLVVAHLGRVELLEVLPEALEGLVERGQGLPGPAERRGPGQHVVLD